MIAVILDVVSTFPPPQGFMTHASGVTTGATVWITRLSVSSAFEGEPNSPRHSHRRRPLERRPLGCVARVRRRRRAPRRPARLCPESGRPGARP